MRGSVRLAMPERKLESDGKEKQEGFFGWLKDKMSERDVRKNVVPNQEEEDPDISLSAITKRFETDVSLVADKVMVMLRRDGAQKKSENLGGLIVSSDLPEEKKKEWFNGQEIAWNEREEES